MSAPIIKTLRLRLTLWHAGLFAALALVVFVIAYYMVSRQLLHAIDMDLQDTAQEFAEQLASGGITALQAEVDSETASHGEDLFFARFLDRNNRIQVEHLPAQWRFPVPRPLQDGGRLQWFEAGEELSGGPVRVLALSIDPLGWIEIGISLTEYRSQMQQIRTVFAAALLVMVVLGVLAGWLQLRTVFRSVEQVRSTALGISEGELDRRIELHGTGQELSELANAFNKMLDRIQLLLKEMRDVSDHIAHDLRTPVSRIRGLAESSLLKSGSATESKDEALAAIVEESDRLSEMINTMLEIAQTDSGLSHIGMSSIDIADIVADACELFLPVAEDAGITMEVDTGHTPIEIPGDAARLQRVIANLLDNAIKFTAAGGHIRCRVERTDKFASLTISDTGTGISAEALPHLFERFYRADNSRSTPGNGLGLSYAQSVIRAHGGEISIDSLPGQGTTVAVHLPLSAP